MENKKDEVIDRAAKEIEAFVEGNGAYFLLYTVDGKTGCYVQGTRDTLVDMLTAFGLHSDIERSIIAEALRNVVLCKNNKKCDA